jgi:hypothetical protein
VQGPTGPQGATGTTGATGATGAGGSGFAPANIISRTPTLSGGIATYEIVAGDIGNMIGIAYPDNDPVEVLIPEDLTLTYGDRIEIIAIHLGTPFSFKFSADSNVGIATAIDRLAQARSFLSTMVLTYISEEGDPLIQNWLLTGDLAEIQNISEQTDAYTFTAADAGKLVTISSSTAEDATIDDNLNLAIGQSIDIMQTGTGQVTIVGSGASVNGTPGLKLRAQYSAATIYCTGPDTYIVVGDLSA